MTAYVFRGELFCEDCARLLRKEQLELGHSANSVVMPKPYGFKLKKGARCDADAFCSGSETIPWGQHTHTVGRLLKGKNK